MKLIDVCELIVDCPHSTAKDEGQGIPLVRTPNIGKGRLELSGVHRVSEDIYNQRIERAVPQAGDLILAREAPVGNVALIMPGQKVCLGQRVVLIRPDKEKADAAYLTYYLLSEEVQYRLKNNANGAVVAHLNMNEIRNLAIDLPELSIQKRIASILSSLDDKISINNRINHNLEEQAQALYKSWFIDFEPFKGGKFVDSGLGLIPEGWHVGTLSEIADITMGQSPSGSSFNEDGRGIVFYQGRTEFGFRFPLIKLFTTEPTRYAEPHSVLMSVRAPVGDINVALVKCCIGRGLAAITAKYNAYSFVLYTLKGKSSELDLYNGEGTVFGSINRKDLERLSVLIPPKSIIQRFNDCIKPIDDSIEIACKEIVSLSYSRDSLLPKLMSGQLTFDALDC